jgi:phytoene dehydrogenase-like protein
MSYDVIIVGGGISGLTAAAYLAKSGRKILLCEKEAAPGGLVNSFQRDGFVYDGGIRALENSGVLFPMLKHLGLDIEFVHNHVSVGIEDQVIRLSSDTSAEDYRQLLIDFYPESRDEIDAIMVQIRQIMHYMEVQYGIDNPIFLDFRQDREYLVKVIVPWMFKYAFTFRKISALNIPVVDFLKRFTHNQSLLDIITQHFFQETPAFFALSYLKLYLDYYYPLGGTGTLTTRLTEFMIEHGGTIQTQTEIRSVDPENKRLTTADGRAFSYRKLIWAADNKSLYRRLDLGSLRDPKIKQAILDRQETLHDKTGNDSVLTLYLGLDIKPEFFAGIATEHFFYTPDRRGQGAAGPIPYDGDRQSIETWLAKFFTLTTYEIACPVLRDPSLAPAGKTGLIISVLFDYTLTKTIAEMGWYEAFKTSCETHMIEILNNTIFPGILDAILHRFSATPLTMEKITGNTDGAITGWSFTNRPMPAESRLPKIMNAIRTPIPGVLQAGQWTYSPSGLPIAILTGKLAADQAIKDR